MILTFDKKKLLAILVAALAVVSSVSLKNSAEQLRKGKNGGNGKNNAASNAAMYLGIALFTLGWLAVAYDVSDGGLISTKSILGVVGALGVLISVMALMWAKEKGAKGEKMMPILSITFALSWLFLGYSVGMGKGTIGMTLGIGAAVMVILSMLLSLPWQRKKCVVDGPGMALFALGWVSLSLGHALIPNRFV